MKNKQPQIDIGEMLKRVRTGTYEPISTEPMNSKKNMSMRDMLKITRKLNENSDKNGVDSESRETVFDQKSEEDKFREYFSNLNVNIVFSKLIVENDRVFWGGVINEIIVFIYKVAPNKKTSGVEINYLEDFSPDNPDNDEIIKRIESYYDTFYKYWRNNILEK